MQIACRHPEQARYVLAKLSSQPSPHSQHFSVPMHLSAGKEADPWTLIVPTALTVTASTAALR